MHRTGVLMLVVAMVAIGGAGAAVGQPAGPAVSFDEQTTGGTTVTVDSVTLPDGGFVTIHDATVSEGGEETFSSVRGTSTYLEPGTHENVTVTLDQPIESDTTLVVMAHKDSDGDRTYTFVSSGGANDGPYTADGDIVLEAAEVTASATVEYDAAVSNGDRTTVDRVELSKGGFVTIHDASLLDGDAFGSVVGTSGYLSAGVHENVVVTFDESVSGNATLIAMPHKDTNGNEEYDFVTSDGAADGPYTDTDGNIVLDPSEVTVTGDEGASVRIENQSTGGNLLYVEDAYLPSGGFVTIHDSTLVDGATFDSVRGTSAYLEPGHHEHVAVRLDEPLEEDETVYAMPHKDTNGNEAYDFVTSDGAEDGPYTDVDGNIVLDSATATVSAGVHIHGQESAGDTVTVASVDLSEPGFVTIHDASLTAGATFDSVRGSTYLEAGLHEDVKVTLDEPLTEPTTVYAMPHKDTNGNEEYDFVTSDGAEDGPFTANGNIVLGGAQVSVLSQVSVAAQESDGTTVTVDSVTLHDGGFVTIHGPSLAEGDAFGSVLGTSEYLPPGTHEDVEIRLDGGVAGDVTLYAMPHKDTNGNEAYDFVTSDGAEDGPYTAGGDIVFRPMEVSVQPATVTFADQTTDGETVTVDSTMLPAGGFLTVHDASLLDGATFDSVRGTSDYLSAGTHEDVAVTLDEPVEESGTFIAMPHKDTNGNEAYDFVTSEGADDGPYTTSGGDIVLADASITLEGGMTDTTETQMDGTDTEEMEMDSTATPTSSGGQPGFGFAVAIVALVGAALVAFRSGRDA